MGRRFCISKKFPGDAHAAGPWMTLSRKDLTYCPQVLLHLLDTILSRTLSIAIHRNPTQIGIIKKEEFIGTNKWELQGCSGFRHGCIQELKLCQLGPSVPILDSLEFAPFSGRLSLCDNKDGPSNSRLTLFTLNSVNSQ